MNKTVTVNIGGIVFHIDENAYEKFKKYLESIRSHFTQSEGRDEIMQDIESRIAEMFQEKIKDSKHVITLEDVDQVTTQMGKPEQFGDEDEQAAEGHETDTHFTVKRRMFRNPDDKLLGGVCSGIANYFDIDTVWVRLLFVIPLLAWGSGIFLYILLWIILPEAKTTAEKLQMRGEKVNISNIEKNIKEEREYDKSRAAESGKERGKKAGTAVGRIFEAIGEVIKFFFLFLGKLISIVFLFVGLVVVFCLVMSLFAFLGVPGTQYPEIWRLIFDSSTQFTFAYIGILLLVSIPFLMLAYLGARTLFNIRKGSRAVGLTALGLWLIGLGICLFIGIRVADNFSEKENVRNSMELIQPKNNKVVLEMVHTNNEEKDYGYGFGRNWKSDFDIKVTEENFISSNVSIDIVKSQTDSFELVEIFYARGNSKKAALESASKINYTYIQSDSVISLQRFFSIDKVDKYRAQKVQVLLKVPVGAEVFLDQSLSSYIYDIDNIQNIYDRDMLGRTWKMTSKGLSCVDCDGTESSIDGRRNFFYDDDGSHIRIDDSGVHISGPDGEQVAIDSNGVIIRDGKKTRVKIDTKGIKVTAPPAPEPPAIRL
ncbi:MAG TPA: PspC domain-containing protein [Bacteroidia bacterium]|nr:PspC domain-containing protein [Bacteroidia bacterium]HNS11845.1 PspC domain-containing protein [Bacteroidia bacterium]